MPLPSIRQLERRVIHVDWVLFVVQWLHVLAGITWFGAVLYSDFVVIPAILTLSPREQRSVGGAIGAQAVKVIPGVAIAVIVLGILRGTVWGPIKSFDALTTNYGLTWLAALILAIGTFAFAKLVIETSIERLNAFDIDQATLPDGSANPAFAAAVAAVKRNTLVELVGFFLIFTCMILMRFGQ
jgi:uncharacterized membrane protein